MEVADSAVILALLLFGSLALGTWIFTAILVSGALGLYFAAGFSFDRIGAIMQPVFWKSATGWELAAIPLFVWMGEIVVKTNMTARIFNGLTPFVAKLPGGLYHTNVLGSTLFSAVCGSSAAATATVGKITLEELKARGYNRRLSVGSLAGAGSLGIMIPPSIPLIIYGLLAEVSIARLFVAGILPGLMIAGMFSIYIATASFVKPELVPAGALRIRLTDVLRGFIDLLPLLILIGIVMGSIWSGIATPSEAASVGVVVTVSLALVLRVMSWRILVESLTAAVRLSTIICIILVSASFLSTSVAMLQIPAALTRYISEMGLSPFALLLVLTVLYLVLGCFLEGLSMMVLTLPLALPLIVAAGWDPLWFGIYLVIMIELATITPPVGFNLFVIQALSGHSIGYVARAALPFFVLMCLAAALIAIFPQIVMIGPEVLLGR